MLSVPAIPVVPAVLSLTLLAACATPPTAVPPPAVVVTAPEPLVPDRFEPVPEYVYLPDPTTGAERAVLARLEQELTLLEKLVREAQAQAHPDARVRFRYDLLQRDLEAVRHGVRQHLQGPGTAPRTFEPLRGDYRG